MRTVFQALVIAAGLSVAASGAAFAQAKVGEAAPTFSATDASGKTVKLEDYRGKTVVLEWSNHDCPFVRKHYGANNMQALQKKWTEQGVVWLTVISSPPGEQGHVTPEKANALTVERNAKPTSVVLDPDQKVAKLYQARTTPHMYIVNKDGKLAYAGGIDDKPSTRADDIKTAKNFVDAALAEVLAGKPVTEPVTRAYGCTVKYSS
jgi:peroxiredoxin